MKAIVFGATPSAKTIYMEIEKEYEIVALTDNDPQKWRGGGDLRISSYKTTGYKRLELGRDYYYFDFSYGSDKGTVASNGYK